MQTRAPLCALAFLVLSAAGCLPGRDNPFDPTRAPQAELVVAELPRQSDGACPSADDPAAAAAVDLVSRGRCLVLDASASRDPQGTSDLRYHFTYLVGTNGTPLTRPDTEVGIPRYVLGTDLLLAAPLGQSLRFQVEVTDGHSTDRAESEVILTNARPSVIAQPSRTLPLGGFPWDPKTTMTVSFAAQGSDPDGDPLLYCWQFRGLGLDAAVSCGPDATVVRDLPVDRRSQVVAQVYVDDRALTSLPATTTVDIGPPEVWRRPTAFATRFSRLDPLRTVYPQYDVQAANVGFLRTTSGENRVVISAGSGLQLSTKQITTAPFPAAVPTATPTSLGVTVYADLAADATRGRVWALLGAAPTNVQDRVRSYLLQPNGSLTAELAPTPWPRAPDFDQFLAVDAEGHLWTAGSQSSTLRRVDLQGTVTTIADDPAWVVTALGARPQEAADAGSGEVWVLREKVYVSGELGRAELVRYSVPEGTILQTIDIGAPSARGLAWIHGREFWTFVAGEGLYRIDAGLLENGTPFENAVVLFVPEVFGARLMMANPGNGSCFVAGGAREFVVSGDGAVVEIDYPSNFVPHAVDPDGALWFSNISYVGLTRGVNPTPDGVADSFDMQTPSVVVADLAEGGLWLASSGSPSLLQRVSREGHVVEVISRLRPPGTTGEADYQLPPISALHMVPDGSAAYAFLQSPTYSSEGIYRLELAGRAAGTPPVAVPFLDATFQDALSLTGSVLEPSAPVPDSTPFVWSVVDDQNLRAVTLDAGTAASTTRFSIPAVERQLTVDGELMAYPSAARLPGSNALCLATVNTSVTPNQLHLRRIRVGSGEVFDNLTTFALPGFTYGVGASHDPIYGDVCWLYYSTPVVNCANYGTTTLEAWVPGVGRVRTFSETNYQPTNVFPISADLVWLGTRGCDGAAPFPNNSPTRILKLEYRAGAFVPQRYDASVGQFMMVTP